MIIGINGRPGSGKTTVSKLIYNDKDKEIIHLDYIFNEVKNKNLKKSITFEDRDKDVYNYHFNNDSIIKRILLSKYIKWLYNYLKSIYAKKYVNNIIKENKSDYLILEGRQLKIYNLEKICDVKVFVHSSSKVRYERTIKRDTYKEKKEIIKELDEDEKERIDTSDYIILYNTGDINKLKEEIKVLEKKIGR